MNDLQRIAILYRGLLLFNLFMLIVIFIIFPEPFSILGDPLSWLGKVGPGEGLAFYYSFWLFSAALLYNIFRWSQILLLLSKYPVWRRLLVRIAGWAVSAGFILMLFPCDRFDPIHSTGGTLVGLGMWMLSTMILIRSDSLFERRIKVWLHLILHASALFCIANFALDTSLKGFSQRPAILTIVVITNICLILQLQVQQKSGNCDNLPVSGLLAD
ncbi:MAG: hypothetical protein SCJ94_08100 [Bacillota bacterium]|nr:hypothetical protein [Bacillota bacterium]MDW7729955.1 hypothetical protein [Bacillota bacterium]